MDTVVFESQLAVVAATLNGEVTWAPFTGAVMVMADMVAVPARSVKMEQRAGFIENPQIMISEYEFVPAEGAHFDAVTDCMST